MKRLTLIDPAPAQVIEAADWIESVAKHCGMEQQAVARLKTCTVEAINNSIEHGYGFTEGVVEVEALVQEDSLIVEVVDFSEEAVIAPAEDSCAWTPDAERGRGWKIISNWTDVATFVREPGRTRVRLTNRISV